MALVYLQRGQSPVEAVLAHHAHLLLWPLQLLIMHVRLQLCYRKRRLGGPDAVLGHTRC